MTKLNVLIKKESLEEQQLANQVVIVLDILFATSTIVHALAQGATSVWPAMDRDEAVQLAARLNHAVLAGEYLAEPLAGFASPLPLALARKPLRDRPVVYCTTNGTVALRRAANAMRVYAGALLNCTALVTDVVRRYPKSPVLIVCAGSAGHFNLEDFYGAGHIVAQFMTTAGYEPNDAARAAALLYLGCESRTALYESRVGRLMISRGQRHEVEYAATRDALDVVVYLDGEKLVLGAP
jgi:2-phosphosulfolactate phosphatase